MSKKFKKMEELLDELKSGKNVEKKLKADINNDGVVDEKDLSLVHKEFHKQKKKKATKKKVKKKD